MQTKSKGLFKDIGASWEYDEKYYYLPFGFHGKEYLDVKNLFAKYVVEGRWLAWTEVKHSLLGISYRANYANGFSLHTKVGIDYKIGGYVDMFAQIVVDYAMLPKSKGIGALGGLKRPNYTILQTGLEVGFGF